MSDEKKVGIGRFCLSCGGAIKEESEICPKCGVSIIEQSARGKDYPEGYKPKRWVTALLSCLFLGVIGVHRFYVGKIGTGVLQVLTVGGLGVWTVIDLISILLGKFTDKNGYLLEK